MIWIGVTKFGGPRLKTQHDLTCAEEVLQKQERGFNQEAVCIHVSFVFDVSVDVGCRIMQVRLALEFEPMTTNHFFLNLGK